MDELLIVTDSKPLNRLLRTKPNQSHLSPSSALALGVLSRQPSFFFYMCRGSRILCFVSVGGEIRSKSKN